MHRQHKYISVRYMYYMSVASMLPCSCTSIKAYFIIYTHTLSHFDGHFSHIMFSILNKL